MNRNEGRKNWHIAPVPCAEGKVVIRYRLCEDRIVYLLSCDDGKKRREKYYDSFDALRLVLLDLTGLLCRHNGTSSHYEKEEVEVQPANEAIRRNPMYAAALAQGDELLAQLLRIEFRAADPQDEAELSGLFGWRFLPELPAQFDRDYNIKRDTIDFDMLYRSGYRWWHLPNICMMGHTRKNYTLNPNRKRGVDAAPEPAPAISFQKYLKLFD